MSGSYYSGHTIEWMEKFLEAIPRKQQYKKAIAYALASCICHQYVYTKKDSFKLNHAVLAGFGLNRRSIKLYLEFFTEAGLIEYSIEKGKSPVVRLILTSNILSLVNKYNLNKP